LRRHAGQIVVAVRAFDLRDSLQLLMKRFEI